MYKCDSLYFERRHMYKVQPFIWYDLKENRTMFQTQNSTTVISCDNAGAKRMVILSNDDKFISSAKYNLSENKIKISFVPMSSLKEFKFSKEDIVVVFLNPFELQDLEKLVNVMQSKNVICKFIFSYNNKIYFSNFYKKDWSNPCPLCFFYEIESRLRGDEGESHINFQTIIDLLYGENIQFKSELPLEKEAYLNIVFYLAQTIQNVSNQYKVDEIAELNLDNYEIKRDIAYHWGYCDCYE